MVIALGLGMIAMAAVAQASGSHGTAPSTVPPSSAPNLVRGATEATTVSTPRPAASSLALPTAARQAAAGAAVAARSGWVAWAVLDRESGTMVSSKNATDAVPAGPTLSMWLAAAWLRQAEERDVPPPSAADVQLLQPLLRTGSIAATSSGTTVYERLGGADLVNEMIGTCRLRDSSVAPSSAVGPQWAATRASARDMARVMDCVLARRNGMRAVSLNWMMAQLRATPIDGGSSIAAGLPRSVGPVASVNGWVDRGGSAGWTVGCLASFGPSDRFVVSVQSRYRSSLGSTYGLASCKTVAAALFG